MKILSNNSVINIAVHSENISTRMHSSRMRTARSSSRLLGVSTSVHAGTPPGCGPGEPPPPPQARPLNFPLGCGPGDLQGMLGYLPTNSHTPPCTEFLTHATENIALPQTSFASGNDSMINCFSLSYSSERILARPQDVMDPPLIVRHLGWIFY